MSDEQETKPVNPSDPVIDENMPVFVYGSIEIKDVESNVIILKKSF